MKNFKNIVEAAEQARDGERPVTKSDLNKLETYLDKLWGQIGMDIEFSRHFLDRLNDARNQTQITIRELAKIFVESFKKHGGELSRAENLQAVLTDLSSKVNIPFVIQWNRRTRELELMSKTIMRKTKFGTSNKRFTVK